MLEQDNVKKEEEIHADFEHTYVTYFSRMVRFAGEYVWSEEDAKDVVQDVFTDLWEKRHVYTDRISVTAFIFTSIKNKCIDYLRHRLKVREAEDLMQEEYRRESKLKFDTLEAFNQSILTEEDVEKVIREAADKLPEKCREIFIKSKFEGKKQKEIALELNISENTVETQMGIAYTKLREILEDYLPLLLFLIYW
ncbi:MAG: RNA polymerase sigma-70 factor [Tannerella sp.]|jgi:RNA polymerase sigma-70 factor (ECF subfamily)|nr:RNA polymerase sigma-70 factor [Tannerella sp.]